LAIALCKVLKKSRNGPAFAVSFTIDRKIDNKITTAWSRRFTKTASCHALAMRARGARWPVPQSRKIYKILRLLSVIFQERVSINDDAINYP
jgi:hypothetical protein